MNDAREIKDESSGRQESLQESLTESCHLQLHLPMSESKRGISARLPFRTGNGQVHGADPPAQGSTEKPKEIATAYPRKTKNLPDLVRGSSEEGLLL